MKLVLLVGQSNMAGRDIAGPDDLTEIPEVLYISKDHQWRPAIEPITKDRPQVGTFKADGTKCVSPDPWDNLLPENGEIVRGVGPGRSFGRLLQEAFPGETVGLIPAAVGGTPIRSWKPGGVDVWDENNFPYDSAIALTKEAMKHGELVAILWHQGETDSKENNPNYKEDLLEVIANFRRDLNSPEVPFILGELGDYLCEPYKAESFNRIMHDIAAELPFVGVAGSAGLTHRGDHLHFSTESAHELGRRYFREFQILQERMR